MRDGDRPRPAFPIVISCVWGVLLLPGLLGAVLSVMFFDAPGSMGNPAAWINALVVVSFPCLCVVSIAGSWIAWTRSKSAVTTTRAQLTIAALPLLPVLYFVAVMAIGTIGILFSGQPLGLHSTVIQNVSGPSPHPYRT